MICLFHAMHSGKMRTITIYTEHRTCVSVVCVRLCTLQPRSVLFLAHMCVLVSFYEYFRCAASLFLTLYLYHHQHHHARRRHSPNAGMRAASKTILCACQQHFSCLMSFKCSIVAVCTSRLCARGVCALSVYRFVYDNK